MCADVINSVSFFIVADLSPQVEAPSAVHTPRVMIESNWRPVVSAVDMQAGKPHEQSMTSIHDTFARVRY